MELESPASFLLRSRVILCPRSPLADTSRYVPVSHAPPILASYNARAHLPAYKAWELPDGKSIEVVVKDAPSPEPEETSK